MIKICVNVFCAALVFLQTSADASQTGTGPFQDLSIENRSTDFVNRGSSTVQTPNNFHQNTVQTSNDLLPTDRRHNIKHVVLGGLAVAAAVAGSVAATAFFVKGKYNKNVSSSANPVLAKRATVFSTNQLKGESQYAESSEDFYQSSYDASTMMNRFDTVMETIAHPDSAPLNALVSELNDLSNSEIQKCQLQGRTEVCILPTECRYSEWNEVLQKCVAQAKFCISNVSEEAVNNSTTCFANLAGHTEKVVDFTTSLSGEISVISAKKETRIKKFVKDVQTALEATDKTKCLADFEKIETAISADDNLFPAADVSKTIEDAPETPVVDSCESGKILSPKIDQLCQQFKGLFGKTLAKNDDFAMRLEGKIKASLTEFCALLPAEPEEGGQTPEEGGQTPEEGGQTPEEGGQTPEEGGQTPEEGGQAPEEAKVLLEEAPILSEKAKEIESGLKEISRLGGILDLINGQSVVLADSGIGAETFALTANETFHFFVNERTKCDEFVLAKEEI